MKTAILAVLLLVSIPAVADEWTTGDTYREATYLSLLAVDWAQTRDCLRRPGCYEENTLLGAHPKQSSLDAYVVLEGLAHIAIAKMLPEKYRAPFQYITIGMEGNATFRNLSLGSSIKF